MDIGEVEISPHDPKANERELRKFGSQKVGRTSGEAHMRLLQTKQGNIILEYRCREVRYCAVLPGWRQ